MAIITETGEVFPTLRKYTVEEWKKLPEQMQCLIRSVYPATVLYRGLEKAAKNDPSGTASQILAKLFPNDLIGQIGMGGDQQVRMAKHEDILVAVDVMLEFFGLSSDEEFMSIGEGLEPFILQSRLIAQVYSLFPDEDAVALDVAATYLAKALEDPRVTKSAAVASVVEGVIASMKGGNQNFLGKMDVAELFAKPSRRMIGKESSPSEIKLVFGHGKARRWFDEWCEDPAKFKNKSKFYDALKAARLCDSEATGRRWLKEFLASTDPASPLVKKLAKK